MATDPYVYSGTDVLINRFDIRDQSALQEVENYHYSLRTKGLATFSGKSFIQLNKCCYFNRLKNLDL